MIPFYAGIERLEKQGDEFQWGGPRLCEGGVFPLPGGKARFELVDAPSSRPPEGEFILSTRRGKQFNSIVQADIDPLTGAARDHVLVHPDDLGQLGFAHDQPIAVQSEHGRFVGRAFEAQVTRGTVQMHWPEANVLIAAGRVDPGGLVPDYNAVVRLGAP